MRADVSLLGAHAILHEMLCPDSYHCTFLLPVELSCMMNIERHSNCLTSVTMAGGAVIVREIVDSSVSSVVLRSFTQSGSSKLRDGSISSPHKSLL